LRRVKHRDIDSLCVHVGDARVRVVAARHAQAFGEVAELLRRQADGSCHLVDELATPAAHLAAGVHGLVHVILDDLARDPVAPPLGVHALGPEVFGLHDMSVAVDDQRLLRHAHRPL
jgi:hypothetical protein